MARKRHTPEEIVTKLQQVDVLTAQGKAVADAIRSIGVTEVSYYRWRNEYGGLKGDQVKRLKELETENARLPRAGGPEFVAKALRDWIATVGAGTAYIEPGSPWENGYCESFSGKLRNELLNGEIFYTLKGTDHDRSMATTLQHGSSALIAWIPAAGTEVFTTVCPHAQSGPASASTLAQAAALN